MNIVVSTLKHPEAARPNISLNRNSRASKTSECHVAVIGAGPYGLSISAHLKAAKVETRTFGTPMSFWQNNMPRGMKLRSPWRGSHLSDAGRELTLDAYAKTAGFESIEPLPLERFVSYGQWFQSQAVGDIDTRRITRIERDGPSFRLHIEDCETITARHVVVALGLANQDYRPEEFVGLPQQLASHSAQHADPLHFKGQRVAVIGRGQSACETAVLLQEAGAEVELISRGAVRWIGSEMPEALQRSGSKWWAHKLLSPPNPVGPFPLNWLAGMPPLLRLMSKKMQRDLGARCLKPAASAWLRPRADNIVMKPGCFVTEAISKGRRVNLTLSDGSRSEVDHVLLATGYRVDISRLGILSNNLLQSVATEDGSPILGRGYESTLEGLHFAGASSVNSFGPQMRFVWGAGYAARNITRMIASGGR